VNAIVSCCAGNPNQSAALCGKPAGLRDYTSMAMSALQQALQAPPSDCFSGCVSMLPVLWDQPWGDTTSAGSQTACFMMKAGSRAPCVSIAHHLGKDHARCWLGKLCWRMSYMASNFLSVIELYSGRQKSVSKTSPCLAQQFVCDDSST